MCLLGACLRGLSKEYFAVSEAPGNISLYGIIALVKCSEVKRSNVK